jgi:hypothetical protein
MEDSKGHPAHVLALLALLLLAASAADAQVGLRPDMNETEAQQVSEIQRRLIGAALQRRASLATSESESDKAAGAPAPAQAIGNRRAEAEAQAGAPSAKPFFAGTSIPQSTRQAPGPRGAKAASTAFPVMTTDALEHLSDAELFGIFHKGTAEIPSALPGQLGKPCTTQWCCHLPINL